MDDETRRDGQLIMMLMMFQIGGFDSLPPGHLDGCVDKRGRPREQQQRRKQFRNQHELRLLSQEVIVGLLSVDDDDGDSKICL